MPIHAFDSYCQYWSGLGLVPKIAIVLKDREFSSQPVYHLDSIMGQESMAVQWQDSTRHPTNMEVETKYSPGLGQDNLPNKFDRQPSYWIAGGSNPILGSHPGCTAAPACSHLGVDAHRAESSSQGTDLRRHSPGRVGSPLNGDSVDEVVYLDFAQKALSWTTNLYHLLTD